MTVPFYTIPITGYLIGSIPTGYWLGSAWKGVDVRQHGSGNLGATNVFRVLGKVPGFVTLMIDILKGLLPTLACKTSLITSFYPIFVPCQVSAQPCTPGSIPVPPLILATYMGIAAILGHTLSIFVGFRGGKGVATSAGVFAALLPIPSAFAIGAFIACLVLTRMVSASSITASLVLAIAAFVFSPRPILLPVMASVIAILVIVKHRANMGRIWAGTESRIGSERGARHGSD